MVAWVSNSFKCVWLLDWCRRFPTKGKLSDGNFHGCSVLLISKQLDHAAELFFVVDAALKQRNLI